MTRPEVVVAARADRISVVVVFFRELIPFHSMRVHVVCDNRITLSCSTAIHSISLNIAQYFAPPSIYFKGYFVPRIQFQHNYTCIKHGMPERPAAPAELGGVVVKEEGTEVRFCG